MIVPVKLDTNSVELVLTYSKSHPLSVDRVEIFNTCGSMVAELSLMSYRSGKGKFRLNNDVHALPFGRYNGTIYSGNCQCGCFPIDIPKCNIIDISVNDRVNDLHCDTETLPVRECATCDCGCECSDKCCDECTGCTGINPCDKCHPCYTDQVENVVGSITSTDIPYTQEAEDILFP